MYPLDLKISTNVIDKNFYSIRLDLSINVRITGIRFSQIFFNSEQIELSNKYFIDYEIWEVDAIAEETL